MKKINSYIKISLIIITLLNISLSEYDKNTLMNFKVELDNSFRQNLDMNPDLYRIWIGTTSKNEHVKEHIPGLPMLPGTPNFNYIIKVYMDDSYNQPYMINKIKGSILDVWPAFGETGRLEKNVTIIAMSFSSPDNFEELKAAQKIVGRASGQTKQVFKEEKVDEKFSIALEQLEEIQRSIQFATNNIIISDSMPEPIWEQLTEEDIPRISVNSNKLEQLSDSQDTKLKALDQNLQSRL